MLIVGHCHCANIGFELLWHPDPEIIHARSCTCSFCSKHGGVWTTKPDSTLKISVKDPALVSRYAFETRTAEFHICTRCGVVPVVTSLIAERLYAAVNVNAFENVAPSLLNIQPMSFTAENEAERLVRRQRHWIANVQMTR